MELSPREPDEIRALSRLALDELHATSAASRAFIAPSPSGHSTPSGRGGRRRTPPTTPSRTVRGAPRCHPVDRHRRRRGPLSALSGRGPSAVHVRRRQRGSGGHQRADGRQAGARGQRPPGADVRARPRTRGAPEADALAAAFAGPTPHLAFFVHGTPWTGLSATGSCCSRAPPAPHPLQRRTWDAPRGRSSPALLNHPTVYERLRKWLAVTPA
jgi:hypothetical protein